MWVGIFVPRTFRSMLVAVLASWLLSGPALAEKRVALVIGNSAYENVARLSNPANDADAMTSTLKGAGFDVVESRRNLKIGDMRRAFRDFADKSRDADVAVVYYAGHGIEVDGTNYLIPVDAALERDLDVYDEAFPLERILISIDSAKQLRLVILDACRDNPFNKTMKRTIGSRAVGRGLAKVEPTSPNTLIAFASKAGSTASDGDSKNSPFTSALVKYIATPGLDLRKAFGYVRDDVLKNTRSRQEPYVYGSLGGDDVPLVPGKPSSTLGAQADPQASVHRDYEFALQLGTRDGWEAFLLQYNNGFYANLAKGQLNKIARQEAGSIERPKIAAAGEEAKDKQTATEKAAGSERKQLASLPPSDTVLSPTEVTTSVQLELRRVGCLTAAATGEWNSKSQLSLALFNKYAGTNFDTKLATNDALEALKTTIPRVCPPSCDPGFKADGDHCTKISCRTGYHINDDNECERVQNNKPIAPREGLKSKRDAEPKQAGTPKPQASGQIICSQQGCRPLRPGCRAVLPRSGSLSSQMEVCN